MTDALKFQEEERERHVESVPELSEADTNHITADPDTMSLLAGAWIEHFAEEHDHQRRCLT